MKLGFLYAGQGSQHPGMGQDLYETYPAFREVLDRAETDFDLKALCFQGPENQLNQTRFTQPCMVAFAAGLTAVLKEMGIVPDLVAGLSLGEYSALAAAGGLETQTAISLAAFRGKAPPAMTAPWWRFWAFPGSSFWKPSGNPSPWVQWSLPTTTVPASWFWGETRRRCSRLPPWQRPGEPAGACPCGSPAPFTRP